MLDVLDSGWHSTKEFLVVGQLPVRTYQWSIKKSTLKNMSKSWETVLRCYESTEKFSECD